MRTDAVERSSDVARLDGLGPGHRRSPTRTLFARRCVESLLYGTPIVVPHDSRAREHAERGRGGLWFANAPELAWCIEAMFDPPIREAFSAQGRAYAEAAFGSTDRFIERVLAACGLASSSTVSGRGVTRRVRRCRVRAQRSRPAAMPSRMSASDTRHSSNPNRVMTAARISAPPTITSSRPGTIPARSSRAAVTSEARVRYQS